MSTDTDQTCCDPSHSGGFDLRRTVLGSFAVLFVVIIGVEACRYLTLPVITADAQLLMLIDAGLLALVAALIIYVARNILGRIGEIAGTFGDAADDITRRSSRMKGTILLLSDSTAEQAVQLAEADAALESLGRTGDAVAQAAGECVERAGEHQDAIERAAEAVDRLGGTAAAVDAGAAASGALVDRINELASRVELLALSAAVEASRAGFRGRGFATVAEEVRALSLEMNAVAGDAEGLIADHTAAAGRNSTVAAEVARSFAAVAVSAAPVREGLARLAHDAAESARRTTRLGRGIGLATKAVQQNSLDAAESAGASHELCELTQTFRGMVRELGRGVGVSRLQPQSRPLRPAPIHA